MKLKRIILAMFVLVLAVAALPSTTWANTCPDTWCYVGSTYRTVDWGTDYRWLDDSGCYGGEKLQRQYYRDYRLDEEYDIYQNQYTGETYEEYDGLRKFYYGEWSPTSNTRYVYCTGY